MKHKTFCRMCMGTGKIDRIKDVCHVGKIYLGIKVYEKCLFCKHDRVEGEEDLLTEIRSIH